MRRSRSTATSRRLIATARLHCMLRSGPPLYILAFNLMTNEMMQGVREGQERGSLRLHFRHAASANKRRKKSLHRFDAKKIGLVRILVLEAAFDLHMHGLEQRGRSLLEVDLEDSVDGHTGLIW